MSTTKKNEGDQNDLGNNLMLGPGERDRSLVKVKSAADVEAERAKKLEEREQIEEERIRKEKKLRRKAAVAAQQEKMEGVEEELNRELFERISRQDTPLGERIMHFCVGNAPPLYIDLVSELGCEKSAPFYVDGDSLLLEVLCDARVTWIGGAVQHLHVLYLVERRLLKWRSIGCTPTVFFFASSEALWAHSPPLLALRRALARHLSSATDVPVNCALASWWSGDFEQLVFNVQPNCFLVSDGSVPDALAARDDVPLPSAALRERLLRGLIFYCMSVAGVHCALTKNVLFQQRHALAFVFSPAPAPASLVLEALDDVSANAAPMLDALADADRRAANDAPIAPLRGATRRQLVARALASIGADDTDELELARVFALHSVLIERLSLEQRIFVNDADALAALDADSGAKVHAFLARVAASLASQLRWPGGGGGGGGGGSDGDDTGNNAASSSTSTADRLLVDIVDARLFYRLLRLGDSLGPLVELVGDSVRALWADAGHDGESGALASASAPFWLAHAGATQQRQQRESKAIAAESNTVAPLCPLLSSMVADEPVQVDGTLLSVGAARDAGVLHADNASVAEVYKWHNGDDLEDPDAHLRIVVPTEKRERRKFLRNQQKHETFFRNYAQSLQGGGWMTSETLVAASSAKDKEGDAVAAAAAALLASQKDDAGAAQEAPQLKTLTKREQKAAAAAARKAAAEQRRQALLAKREQKGKNVKVGGGQARAAAVRRQNEERMRRKLIEDELRKLKNNIRAFSSSLHETYAMLEKYLIDASEPLGRLQAKLYLLQLALRMWTEAYHKSSSAADGANGGDLADGAAKVAALDPRAGLAYAIGVVRLAYTVLGDYMALRRDDQLDEVAELCTRALEALGFVDAAAALLDTAKAHRDELKREADEAAAARRAAGGGAKGKRGKAQQQQASPPADTSSSSLDPSLTLPSIERVRAPTGMTFERFQLEHCGPHMDRGVEQLPDARVPFKPEPWQRQLLDIVDGRESALVVAPTSAGKTFASFYAMKKVLLDNDDDIVVYVAPSKALVNQVAAEVYARFASKQYPSHNNRHVWGMYTRDYRVHPLNCQVLVTVPAILEALLLSPVHSDEGAWASRIRYVIMDEVHCVGDLDGGQHWENLVSLVRAPILALSATIGNPAELHRWMSAAQSEHGHRMHLIVHPHRYSNLYHYTFRPEHACKHIDDVDAITNVHRRADSARRSTVVAVGAPITDALSRIHPIGCLTIKDICRGALVDVAMSPDNVLALFDALRAADAADTANLEPERHFADAAKAEGRPIELLNYTTVRAYGALLKTMLERWARERPELVQRVLETLRSTLLGQDEAQSQQASSSSSAAAADANGGAGGNSPVEQQNNLFKFLLELHEHDLLPTIVFGFDRYRCDQAMRMVLNKLRDLERTKQAAAASGSQRQKKAAKASKRMKAKTASSRQRKDAETGEADDLGGDEEVDDGPIDPALSFVKEGFFADNFAALIDRLKWQSAVTDEMIEALHRGIGVHHDGVPTKYRQVVETLFRAKHLRVVFSTATLAMGINMPCRSTVFLHDSVYLNPTYYAQMSGRSGRRGYDLVGHVIFYSVPWPKVQRLMTSNLPTLSGAQFSLSATFLARLFTLHAGARSKQWALDAVRGLFAQIGDARARVRTAHHVRYCFDMLLRHGLVTPQGTALGLAGLVTRMHDVEPANLMLGALLRAGYLRRVCASYEKDADSVHLRLMHILANLFGVLFYPSRALPTLDEDVVLPPLERGAAAIVDEQNRVALATAELYLRTLVKNDKFASGAGDEHDAAKLPLSRASVNSAAAANAELGKHVRGDAPPTELHLRSPFVASSGHTDDFESIGDLVASARPDLNLERSTMPIFDRADNSDRERVANAYLVNFWQHGSLMTLVRQNAIGRGEVWYFLKDFKVILTTISSSLAHRRQVVLAARERHALGIKSDDDDDDDEEERRAAASSSSATAEPTVDPIALAKAAATESHAWDDESSSSDSDDSDVPDAWDASDSDDDDNGEGDNKVDSDSKAPGKGAAASPSAAASSAAAIDKFSKDEHFLPSTPPPWDRADDLVVRAFTELAEQFTEKFKDIGY
jgi:superfamily II DNA or RNA helicase